MFQRTVATTPDKEALVDGSRGLRYTYAELESHAKALGAVLQAQGVGHQDTFATLLTNGVEITSSILVASRIGAIVNTVNYRQSLDGIEHIVTDSKAEVLVFDPANRDKVDRLHKDLDTVKTFLYTGEDVPDYAESYWDHVDAHAGEEPDSVDVAPEDHCYLIYTSGTTGLPKGCLHQVGPLMEHTYVTMCETRITDRARTLVVAPQAHIAGAWEQGIPTLLYGGTTVTLADFDPTQVLRIIEEEAISHTFAVPTMWKSLLEVEPERYDVGSVQTIMTMAAAVSPRLAREVLEAFDPDYFGNWLGSSEGFNILTNDVTIRPDTAESPGTAFPNAEIRVVEFGGAPTDEVDRGVTGELIVKSPFLMDKYLGLPEENEKSFQDGWYYTGDAGYIGEDGLFWPEGRKKHIINTGGENVSDVHVENVLSEHEDVAEVAVVGVPDDRWGERVVACIVPAAASSLSEDKLLAWADERRDLAGYECPKGVRFMEEFPRSAGMKVQKSKLLERILE